MVLMYYHFHYSYDNLTIITIVSLFINVYLLNYFSPGGGIGRRKGLKIPRGQPRAGSTPALGIIYEKFFNTIDFFINTHKLF